MFHYCSIVRALKERIIERDSKPSAEQCKERKEWNAFWDMLGPQLLLHACQHGSVDMVKFMVNELNCKLMQRYIPVILFGIMHHILLYQNTNKIIFCEQF